jgi:hypothetical protein
MRQGNINHHAVPLRQQWVDFRQGRPILCIMWYEVNLKAVSLCQLNLVYSLWNLILELNCLCSIVA